MTRISPEILDAYRRQAQVQRADAIRRWHPLSWLIAQGQKILSRIANDATTLFFRR